MITSKENYLYLIEINKTICVTKNVFKNVIDKISFKIIYSIYMYKKDLALNNLK